jgi:hypothetical protein
MPPTQPTQGLDPQIVNLAQSIRQVESNNNPTAVGKSGEYGSYQFEPGTWAAKSAAAGVNVPLQQATPEQQNEVAYKTLASWKQQHPDWNIGNFASAWNAGEGAPNAYQENHVGTNSMGVSYDTPGYAKKVADAYQQIKAKGLQQAPTSTDVSAQIPGVQPPQTPGSTAPAQNQVPGIAPPTPPTPQAEPATPTTNDGSDPSGGFLSGLMEDLQGTNPDSIGTQVGNTLKGAGDYLFPSVKDTYDDFTGQNKKTALQQIGDAGLSALTFIPGLGEIGDAARGVEGAADLSKGVDFVADNAGNVTKAADTVFPASKEPGLASKILNSSITKNAAVGYGAGTASNLSQGQSLGQAFTPQASNLGGAILGGGSAGLLNKFGASTGESATISKLSKAMDDGLGATKPGVQANSAFTSKYGQSVGDFLTSLGIAPETEELNGAQKFSTGPDSATQQAVQSGADKLTDLRDQLIDAANPTGAKPISSINTLRNAVLAKIPEQMNGTAEASAVSHINAEFDAYASKYADENGNISLQAENTIKKDLQSKTNFDATRPSIITQANKIAAGVTQEQVENDAEKAGVPGIKPLNKLIQQHIELLDNGTKKGILSKLNGQVVKGGRLGTHVKELIGAGAGAAIGKALGGGPVGEFAGTIAGGAAGNLVSRLMQKFSVGGPGAAAALDRIAREDPPLLQKLTQILEEKGGSTEGLVSPRLVPRKKTTGLASSLVTKGAARVGASL